MKPVSPIVPGEQLEEIIFARNQEQYLPLPAHKLRDDDGTVLTRWELSWKERVTILLSGNIYLWQLTFGKKLRPMMLQAEKPFVAKIRNKVTHSERPQVIRGGNFFQFWFCKWTNSVKKSQEVMEEVVAEDVKG